MAVLSGGGAERSDHSLWTRQRHRKQLHRGQWCPKKRTTICQEPGESMSNPLCRSQEMLLARGFKIFFFFLNTLPRIKKLQTTAGAMNMKVIRTERQRRPWSSFRHRSSGWKERTQIFWLPWKMRWSSTNSRWDSRVYVGLSRPMAAGWLSFNFTLYQHQIAKKKLWTAK